MSQASIYLLLSKLVFSIFNKSIVIIKASIKLVIKGLRKSFQDVNQFISVNITGNLSSLNK